MLIRDNWFGGKVALTEAYQTAVVSLIPDLFSGVVFEPDGRQKTVRHIFQYAPPSMLFRRLAHYRGSYKSLASKFEKTLYFWIHGRLLPYEHL